jgi:hypothetical protein
MPLWEWTPRSGTRRMRTGKTAFPVTELGGHLSRRAGHRKGAVRPNQLHGTGGHEPGPEPGKEAGNKGCPRQIAKT